MVQVKTPLLFKPTVIDVIIRQGIFLDCGGRFIDLAEELLQMTAYGSAYCLAEDPVLGIGHRAHIGFRRLIQRWLANNWRRGYLSKLRWHALQFPFEHPCRDYI